MDDRAPDSPLDLRELLVPPLTTDHGELHVLRDVPGAPTYEELRSRALVIDFDGSRWRSPGATTSSR